MGTVKDPQTKKPIADAIVTVEGKGFNKVAYTNAAGLYDLGNIPAGVYNVVVSFQNHSAITPGVALGNDDVIQVDLELIAAVELNDIPITVTRPKYAPPIIDVFEPTAVTTTGKALKNEGILKIDDALETFGGGAVKIGDDYYVRGARAGSVAYYIDGCHVMGNPDIPLCGLETYRVYNGFIPAKYGNTDAGVVVMETRSFFTEH